MAVRLLNAELIEEARVLLVSGAFLDEVAEALNIHRSSITRWQQRGSAARAKEDAGEELTEDEVLYRDFDEMVRTARGRAKVYAHTQIKRHMEKNYRAAIWYLTVVDPDRYASWKRSEQTGIPTPDQVARTAIESGELPVGEDDREAVAAALTEFIDRRRQQLAAEGGREATGE